MKFQREINFLSRLFFNSVEIFAFICVVTLIAWYAQSRLAVIKQITPPKVLVVTAEYLDVEWHNQRLLDCPTIGTSMFFTPLATGQQPTRPVAASLEEQTYIRRYYFPEGLVATHKYHAKDGVVYHGELRMLIQARCNPLWSTQEIIKVPFQMAKF